LGARWEGAAVLTRKQTDSSAFRAVSVDEVFVLLDGYGRAVALTDMDGNLVCANEVFARSIGLEFELKGEALTLRRSKYDAPSRQAFEALIGRAGRDNGSPHYSLVIPRVGQDPIVLEVRRIELYDTDGRTSYLLLSFVDLSAPLLPSSDLLHAAFTLTPAEVRLAQELARGRTLQEAAVMLAISMPTARTQLASIFAKTHTGRQGRLIAKLTRLGQIASARPAPEEERGRSTKQFRPAAALPQ